MRRRSLKRLWKINSSRARMRARQGSDLTLKKVVLSGTLKGVMTKGRLSVEHQQHLKRGRVPVLLHPGFRELV